MDLKAYEKGATHQRLIKNQCPKCRTPLEIVKKTEQSWCGTALSVCYPLLMTPKQRNVRRMYAIKCCFSHTSVYNDREHGNILIRS